ncbi:S49 family peptidase [Jiella endophytica]|nr:S49 family peptidase [Jiella endophytica]
MRALTAALGTPWAILPHALEEILTIAARENDITPEALEAYRSEAVNRSETLEKRGQVAILNIEGPLFRRANLFTEFSGATSYDIARRDLQVALDDRDIAAILLNVDSPGGAVAGCGELASAIAAATKPVAAYVGGTAASAAYWLASAANEIVVDPSANLGSIGVIVGLSDHSEQDKAMGIRRFEFVSSQSPKKRSDPATEEGASEYQRVADDLAAVFVAAVAKNRGVAEETVVAEFGGGSVLIGAKAVAAGMADSLGSFEETLAKLAKGDVRPRAIPSGPRRTAPHKPKAPASAQTSPKETTMADNEPADALAAENAELKRQIKALEEAQTSASAKANAEELEQLRKDKADRERTDAILALDEAKGRESLAKALASGGMAVEAAKSALAAAPNGVADDDDKPILGAGMGFNSRAGSGGMKKGDRSVLAAAVDRTNARMGKRR